MTNEKLALANDLAELIDTTKNAVFCIKEFIGESTKYNVGGIYGNDKNYSLCICENSDGSGFNANLSRYFGNTKLLNVILDELESQLAKYEEDYKNL